MTTRDLVNAIAAGDAIEIENAFNATMAEKISGALDDRRLEVAQNMFSKEHVDDQITDAVTTEQPTEE